LAFEMSTTIEISGRKWHPEQEKLFVELLSLPEYKPIGGSGDGVMERRQDTCWAPLLSRLSSENAVLVAGQRKTASGLGFKEGFNTSKYKSLKEKCMSLKRDFKVDRHQVSGETGAAADGQPATAQAAIDAAMEAWPLFAAFHSVFGTVQRLRECTASPFPRPTLAQACQPPVSPQALLPRTRKPVPSKRALEATCARGSHEEVDLLDHEGSWEMLDEARPERQPVASSSRSASADTGEPVKKSRLPARDLQMGSAMSESRLKAVETAAKLKEASQMKIMGVSLAKRDDIAERQEEAQHSIANKHLAPAEMDRAVQSEAVAVQREALEEQKRYNAEKLKSAEIIELLPLYVSAGKDPTEARRLARQQALGDE
jgi:hypothetical protein